MGSEQVAAVLRQSGSHVRIVVARPVESGNPDYHQNLDCSAPVVPSSVLADPEELNKYFVSHGYPEISATPARTANILDDYSFCNGSGANLNVSTNREIHFLNRIGKNVSYVTLSSFRTIWGYTIYLQRCLLSPWI